MDLLLPYWGTVSSDLQTGDFTMVVKFSVFSVFIQASGVPEMISNLA